MKWLNSFRSLRLFTVFAASLSGSAAFAQTPAFTLTPSVITNDFVGQIVFNITGLTNGQQIGLQKWADLNGNGVIDGEDYLVQAFKVTDGRVPMIGGVRNTTQPGDTDGATNGQMVVKLNFPAVNLVLDRLAGSFLYRLIDPAVTPAVSLATNAFTILPKVHSQGVTGVAVAADTGAPLTNATLVLIIPEGSGGYSAKADASGAFTVYSPPGDYVLLAFRAGYVANQTAGMVTVVSNSFATKNLTNPPATRVLAGNVADLPSGSAIGGIFVEAENESGLMIIGFTDKNGDFALPVTSDQWRVRINEDSGLALTGHVVDQNVNTIETNTVSGSVSNLNFAFPKANAMFYGMVWDDLSNAVPAVSMSAQDASYRYTAQSLSRADGRYSLAVYTTGSGTWNVGPDNDSLTALGYIGESKNISINNGMAIFQDFTLHSITTHLRGRLVDSLGRALGNTQLSINQGFGTNRGPTHLYPSTAGDGTFDVGLFGGDWTVQLECEDASSSGVIGPSLEITLAEGVDRNDVSVVAQIATGFITGNIRDNSGNPQSYAVYASTSHNGTNYNACSGNNSSSTFQVAVFLGEWRFGIGGDVTSQGFDNPPSQMLTVTGTNTPATIILYPQGLTPPILFAPYYNSGFFHGMLLGSSSKTYRIEATTNLGSTTNWVPVWTNTVQGGWFDFSDSNPPGLSSKFYRAVLVTP